MRIRELLESFNFKEEDFVKNSEDKKELDYDLAEDLVHFMNNDDDAYRMHVYPVVAKCIDMIGSKKPTHSKFFAETVKECYKSYVKKFPIRVLPEEIDEKTLKETCKKMYEAVCNDIKEGKYKE